MKNAAAMCATELAEAIRKREITSLEATKQILERIDATQSTLNAFITIDSERAIQASKRADADVDAGANLGPLHGVPLSVKDLLNTSGVKTTFGSLMMANNVPDHDAIAVQRLREAGAIIVGKTTTSEFGHKLMTDAPLFGVTRNPWNLTLTPGGSSGGSAVAVAAGLGPLSLATDAGASTRLPAALTGIIGFKPTLGLIPHSQVPDTFGNFIHIGILSRTVSDASLMLGVLAGEHCSDVHSIAGPRLGASLQRNSRSRHRGGIRAAWRPLIGNALLDTQILVACENALSVLRDAGWAIDTIEEETENAGPTWRVLQQSNWATRFYDKLSDYRTKLDPSFVEGICAGALYTGTQLQCAGYKRTELFRSVQNWFSEYDFILTPTCSRLPLAVEHGALENIHINGNDAGDMRNSWVPYLNIFNLTGHPAISIPCGFSAEGLPIGLQIVGRLWEDAEVLDAAAEYERRTRWLEIRNVTNSLFH